MLFSYYLGSEEVEAATGGVLLLKAFSEISKNLRENTCVSASFLIKLQAALPGCFPVNFVNLRRRFPKNKI